MKNLVPAFTAAIPVGSRPSVNVLQLLSVNLIMDALCALRCDTLLRDALT